MGTAQKRERRFVIEHASIAVFTGLRVKEQELGVGCERESGPNFEPEIESTVTVGMLADYVS